MHGFLSTPSARRATHLDVICKCFFSISIHALCEEGDPASVGHAAAVSRFLSTPSARRATYFAACRSSLYAISIHALCEEGDFLSNAGAARLYKFLSTPSARRATRVLQAQDQAERISIHALCEEGDVPCDSVCQTIEFLSTPSARRATVATLVMAVPSGHFYPRPLRGGRPPLGDTFASYAVISIHALCEEGDGFCLFTGASLRISIHALCEEGDSIPFAGCSLQIYFYPRPLRGGRQDIMLGLSTMLIFLSTPSARRATGGRTLWDGAKLISIHALCEEGDTVKLFAVVLQKLFLSTPSARRATQTLYRGFVCVQISIHALCEEGDTPPASVAYRHHGFLSTPSARRATAKTETKSLFSNKLYNILHEFRRALIYNGSKSYPNHAK